MKKLGFLMILSAMMLSFSSFAAEGAIAGRHHVKAHKEHRIGHKKHQRRHNRKKHNVPAQK